MLGTVVSLLSLLKYLLWCEKIHIVSNWQSGLVVPVCRFQHYCIRDIHIASNAQFLGVSSPRVVLRNICFSVNGINKQALSHLMWARAIQLAVNLDRAKRQKKGKFIFILFLALFSYLLSTFSNLCLLLFSHENFSFFNFKLQDAPKQILSFLGMINMLCHQIPRFWALETWTARCDGFGFSTFHLTCGL